LGCYLAFFVIVEVCTVLFLPSGWIDRFILLLSMMVTCTWLYWYLGCLSDRVWLFISGIICNDTQTLTLYIRCRINIHKENVCRRMTIAF